MPAERSPLWGRGSAPPPLKLIDIWQGFLIGKWIRPGPKVGRSERQVSPPACRIVLRAYRRLMSERVTAKRRPLPMTAKNANRASEAPSKATFLVKFAFCV